MLMSSAQTPTAEQKIQIHTKQRIVDVRTLVPNFQIGELLKRNIQVLLFILQAAADVLEEIG